MANDRSSDVVITGVGIVTSLGVGVQAHEDLLATGNKIKPVIDHEIVAPYSVHPLPEIDWNMQIPRRGDQRQMGNWQRLGVFAAGLALDDAGFKDDMDACGSMDMIVCAGGGERDLDVDTMIINGARSRNDKDVLLNEKLGTELRPTLFLAQLSNLMAGNISIVHKVTGSSRTFMGEEGSGVSAIETAFARINSGQSTHCLVGGAYVAEREDYLYIFEAISELEPSPPRPFGKRDGDKGGIVFGTAGVFLMLESREHAEKRGAKIYAKIDGVAGDCGPRNKDRFEKRVSDLSDKLDINDGDNQLIISGASGARDITAKEHEYLNEHFANSTVRSTSAAFGHALEAQFPLGLALASIALKNDAKVGIFADGVDGPSDTAAEKIVVTSFGHHRSEGLASLSKA